MKASVISLERAPKRREHIESQVCGLDHHFVPGVDGAAREREEWPVRLPLPLVAACLSHLNAYRAILRDAATGLLREDDAVLLGELPALQLVVGEFSDHGDPDHRQAFFSLFGGCKLEIRGELGAHTTCVAVSGAQ